MRALFPPAREWFGGGSVPEGVSYGHTFRGITRDLGDAESD